MDRRQDWCADSRHLGDGEMALNIHACHSPHAERMTLFSSLSLTLFIFFFSFSTHRFTCSPFHLFPFVLDGFSGSSKKSNHTVRFQRYERISGGFRLFSPLSLFLLSFCTVLVSARLEIHTFHLADLLFAYMLGI